MAHPNSTCNTIRLRQKKSLKPRFRARSWFLTLNNYTDDDLVSLSHEKFFNDLSVKRYIIQEECGENKTEHLQGCVQFNQQVAFSVLKEMHPRIHWEACKDVIKSLKYCGKLDTRNGETFSFGDVDKFIEIEKLHQTQIIESWIDDHKPGGPNHPYPNFERRLY